MPAKALPVFYPKAKINKDQRALLNAREESPNVCFNSCSFCY